MECGYVFDLSNTTHGKMLEASKLSFNRADSSLLCVIFEEAVTLINEYEGKYEDREKINVFTMDDLTIGKNEEYSYYDYYSYSSASAIIEKYNTVYQEKFGGTTLIEIRSRAASECN